MAHRDEPFIVIERSGSLSSFLWGALLGAGAMLLYAPRSGAQARRELAASMNRLRERSEDAVAEVRDSFDATVDDVRREVDARVDAARFAYDRGRDLARDTRDDVGRRVREARDDIGRRVERTRTEIRGDFETRRAATGETAADATAPEPGGDAS